MSRSQNESDRAHRGTRLSRTRAGMAFVLGALALSVGLCLTSNVGYAEDAAPTPAASSLTIDNLSVGIAGAYKNGFQTQVVVSWSGAGEVANVELETLDSDGTPFVSKFPVTSPDATRLEARFIFPKANAKLTVRLLDPSGSALVARDFAPQALEAPRGGEEKGEETQTVKFGFPSASSRAVYLVLGSDSLGFSEAFAEMRWKEERRPAIVRVDSFDELPADPRSYDAIDKLFITTSSPELFTDVTADSPKIRAIEEWVERGGSVVLLADEHAIPLLSEGGALAALSPGAKVAERAQEFRSVNALVTDLQNVKNLSMTGSKSNPYLRVPVVSELKPSAKVEMQEVETPLLVARPVGLGTVVYFAADPSVVPLANWSGRGRLILKILGVDPDSVVAKANNSGFVKRGYLDLSGQVRSALDVFEGVTIKPFSLVAILIFAYLLVIAPIDWLLAKKVFKKPNVTWITFPVWAIAFCVVAVLCVRSSTPKDAVMNQVDVLDVDMASGMTRDSSWFGFYSPVGERYDLNFAPGKLTDDSQFDVKSEQIELEPLTLAGDGIGGAEQKSYVTRVWDEPYSMQSTSPEAKLAGAPLTTRSSKSFFGRWTARWTSVPQLPSLRDDGLVLHGSVYNPFSVPIYSAYVIYDGGAYSLGTLAPGETKIERGMTRLEPARVLNEHQSSVPTALLKSWSITSYNNSSTRLPYILRAASFYDFGGGEDNFGIAKRLQRDVDLSELLRCGRAVIFGTIVDAYSDEYSATEELARKSADAIEMERLNRKIAEQKGETFENAMESSIEKYGLSGSSDSFAPTVAAWDRGDGVANAANKRTVVVRLIVPLER